MKNTKQPKPKKGTTFIGWAVFNWGLSLNTVFRTRKEAKQFCVNHAGSKFHDWHEVKDHMMVVKVICKTI